MAITTVVDSTSSGNMGRSRWRRCSRGLINLGMYGMAASSRPASLYNDASYLRTEENKKQQSRSTVVVSLTSPHPDT